MQDTSALALCIDFCTEQNEYSLNDELSLICSLACAFILRDVVYCS